MKKILFVTLASVLALASCAKFEHDSEYTGVKTGAPVIAMMTQTDSSLFAVVTPADKNTTYYSYAVVSGPETTIDASALLSNSIKTAIASGCFNAADSASVTVEVADLDAGETYTLYSVASSETGTLSKVSTHVFILYDNEAPSFDEEDVEYELSEKDSSVIVSIPFNRNIKFGENAKITVSEWAPLDYYHMTTIGIIPIISQPVNSFDLTAEKKEIEIEDNVLSISVPASVYFPGKCLTFSYDAGTVISLPVSEGAMADIPCKKLNPATIVYGFGAYPGTGPAYTYPTGTFAVEEAEGNPEFVISEFWKDAEFKFVSERPIFNAAETIGSIVYSLDDPKCSSERRMPLGEDNVSLMPGDDTVKVSLSVMPVKGEMIHFELEEGALYDIFGNTSEAYSSEPIGVGALELTFDATKVGCNNFECAATAGMDGLYFVFDYCDDPSKDDATLIKDMKDYIQKWADKDKITFEEEYLEYFACEGTDTLSSDINLESEKEYLVYGFYMLPDGTVPSGVFRKEITTDKFEFPTETTGTFTYATSPFKALGVQPGIPVSINATKDTITISNFGTNGVDLKCAVDKSGNINVVKMPVMKHATYGLVYANEIEDWYLEFYEEEWGSRSYYDSVEKTIYFNIVYHIATGGYFGVGQFADTFHFDNSQPAPAPSAVSNVANVKSVSVSKINAPRRRHVR